MVVPQKKNSPPCERDEVAVDDSQSYRSIDWYCGVLAAVVAVAQAGTGKHFGGNAAVFDFKKRAKVF